MDTQHSEMSEKEMCNKKCGRHRGVRVLTAVIVIIFVFWCGFEFGEIRVLAGFGHENRYSMMQDSWGHSSNGYGSMRSYPMMQAPSASNTTSVSAPTSAVTK